MLTLVIFIAILAILVLAHEAGHFVAARKNGISVEEFGFGFPPRVFGFQIFKEKKIEKISSREEIGLETAQTDAGEVPVITDTITEIDEIKTVRRWRWIFGNRTLTGDDQKYGTVYSLNWVPLGGFVKIKGEDGESTDADSFTSKKIWQRSVVIVAGVVMNVILAAVLLSFGYLIGLPQMTDELPASANISDQRLEIMQVLPDKPAEVAGLREGDYIIQLDEVKNPRLKEMQAFVNDHRLAEINVGIKRGEEIFYKKIKPIVYEDTGKGGLGVAIAEIGIVKYPWYEAIWQGLVATVMYLKSIFVSFYFLIKGLIFGGGVAGAVSGPVGIAVMTGKVARLGFIYLLQFTAVLSLNLAVINILPIPALDGGRLLFLGISKIIRRPVNAKFEQIAHSIGFALLMLLIVVITVKDLSTFRGVFVNLFHKIF